MRKSTSIILAVTFIIVSITGIQLIANHNHNYLVRHIHELVGILFILAGLLHLKLNMKPLLSYAKRK